MTRILAILLAAASALPAATVTSHFREGNTIFLRLSDGSAQVEWLSESSFRFSRSWDGNFVRGPAANPEPVLLNVSETPDFLEIAAKYVVLTIAKNGVLVRTAEPNGATMMADASEAERRDGYIAWERAAPPQARYFGLGAREDATIELRGSRVAAVKPFLLSSLGYGELHVAPGDYTFDIARAKPDRYRIEAHRAKKIDYYFFQGPAPKQVLEQLLILNGPIPWISSREFELLKLAEVPASATVFSKPSLLGTIHAFINGSLSGVLLPALSLDSYEGALQKRAIQLGSITPIVLGSRPDSMKSTHRSDLLAYFATYAQEARERGLPLIRALPMQFPKDLEAAKVSDEFMLGDELLIAPIYDAGNSRSVYLPMGIWTRLSDNQVYPGQADDHRRSRSRRDARVFAKRVDRSAGRESDEAALSPEAGRRVLPVRKRPGRLFAGARRTRRRFHAPADRIESRARLRVDRASQRAPGESCRRRPELKPGAWFYDEQNKNVHVRALVAAQGNVVVNISF